MSDLPLHVNGSKPAHGRSFFSRWRLLCTGALFGAFFYAVSFHIRSFGMLQPPHALQAENLPLLTDPRIATHPHQHSRPPRPPSKPVSFADPTEYLTDYHHLELDELHEMVSKTKGFFVRDWSLHLGWNNMRYIIDAAFIQAKLLNRTLVLPSIVYARACEYDIDVCADFIEAVNKTEALHSDQWATQSVEQQIGFRVPISLMLNITRMREVHPTILVSDYLRLHELPLSLEATDGTWQRGDYHQHPNVFASPERPHRPSLFVVANKWYDADKTIRVDQLSDEMKVRGGWVQGVGAGNGTGGHWPDQEETDISKNLRGSLNHAGVVNWPAAVRRLKKMEVAQRYDLSREEEVIAALQENGWEAVHTFEAVRKLDLAKPVVEPILQAVPRSAIHPWKEEYEHIDRDVLLLAGEIHNGRKPGSIRFTTQEALKEFQHYVLHDMVPIDAIQNLANHIADRMSERTQRRLWMGAHMRRGDFVTAGWVVDKDPASHLTTVKNHLEYGRGFLEDIENVQPYKVPDIEPNLSIVSKDAPRPDDPFYLATDERDPEALRTFAQGGALRLADLLTMDDQRELGWPLMLTDIRALVDQEVLARSAYFSGSALSSVAGGIINMRAARGADRRTAYVD
ncbi:hypothetical protein PENSPDRAFT_270835 [Peniophora sp. CONT]|nr:hypothetical protein PENSPDRAFT_270835 [Peniophora sp. CONT]